MENQTQIKIEVLEEHEEYVDMVAMKVLDSYLRIIPPKNDRDSAKLATVCYKTALAFLEVKLKLDVIATKSTFLQKESREYKRKLENNS